MMPHDEILTTYEDLWRAQALNGARQWHPGTRAKGSHCAILISPRLAGLATDIVVNIVCPFCGQALRSVASVGIHLNDNHRWTWDMFANKFRDVLAQGRPQ